MLKWMELMHNRESSGVREEGKWTDIQKPDKIIAKNLRIRLQAKKIKRCENKPSPVLLGCVTLEKSLNFIFFITKMKIIKGYLLESV